MSGRMEDKEKDIVAELVGEFLDQKNSGQNPRLQEFIDRCPAELRAEFQHAISFVDKVGATVSSSVPLQIPEKIGDFKILREVGRGGMGVVYEAEQQSIPRKVALKLIAPWVLNDDYVLGRMQREAQSIARLRHPNIVTVYSTGEESNLRYLAMEFVPGKGLDEIRAEHARREETIPIPQLLDWAAGIARALQCAHEAGVTHRDVKPSNIRITPEGQAVLIDFGLARDARALSFVKTGAFRGSPYYASPEQVEAKRDGVSSATDVYSLGATLYECVTGRVPFDGETTEQIFHGILTQEPVSPRKLNPLVSRDLETVILKAMEKEVSKRYASAGDFAADLEALLDIRPIQASPTGAVTRSAKWARRNRGWATAIAVGAVGALLLGGVLYREMGTARALENYRAVERVRAAIAAGKDPAPGDRERLKVLLPNEETLKAFFRDPHKTEIVEELRQRLEEPTRGSESWVLDGPRASILSRQPVFRFHSDSAISPNAKYELRLVSEKGLGKSFPLVLQKDAHGKYSFPLPAGEVLELNTRYMWTVAEVKKPSSVFEELPWASFRVVDEFDFVKWVDTPKTGNQAADKILRATIFNVHQMAEETIRELEEFPKEAPTELVEFRRFLLAEAYALINDRATFDELSK